MTTIDTTLFSPAAIPLSPARTTVLVVVAPLETVFNHLANVENLPRWAGDFCESIWLGREHWTALTALGELFVVIEADAAAEEIVFCLGWNAAEFRRLSMTFSRCLEGTCLRFALAASADATEARLFRALEAELPKLVTQLSATARWSDR
ncbi:MAG TPA: hypothetical protein VHO24_04835 [Opitutaceae bacterium]|nr:hypothetical protein [Opitutaceae bacterium]